MRGVGGVFRGSCVVCANTCIYAWHRQRRPWGRSGVQLKASAATGLSTYAERPARLRPRGHTHTPRHPRRHQVITWTLMSIRDNEGNDECHAPAL
eukprot:55914-Eustigmatos_ZCMA.PRE.1